MASGKHCFVIMPFSKTGAKHTSEYWDKFFSNFIKPVVEKFGYKCKRSNAQPGNIMRAIVNELVNSDVVLAVLTDYNANVLYELGTRHSLKHGTIMMLERGQDIPFDIKQYGVIYYEDAAAGVPKFQEDLRDAIQKIESDGPDSPVEDFLNKHTPSTSDKLLEEKDTSLKTCSRGDYNSNTDLQQWILTQMGMNDYENRGTGAQGAISIWQISKQIPYEILPSVRVDNDLICNVLEMKDKKWLKENPIPYDDDDSRSFSLTSNGMLQFRKEFLPMAQMLINDDQRLEEGVKLSKAESDVKLKFIDQLKKFRDKFKDKLEDQAIDYILSVAENIGIKSAIPILIELMKSH
jgi:hypothetical protein